MREIKDCIEEYYSYKKKLDKCKYDINILKDNIKHMEEYVNAGFDKIGIKDRIDKANKKVVENEILADKIKEKMSGLDFYINNLEESEKNILKYRFEKKMQYKEIESLMKMSKPTICRKIKKILNELKDDLE